ncbi:Polyisoprenyl-teichoic acid--peptidoglycan teichoic acid transferase TagU [Apilactobacillus kunkeei]|uniref:LCP family glycopolymer transferase n=1 Tax=Apilactobacillus sp. EABW-1NA TaxID=2984137 RepID=UPI0006C2922C|nr:MULTISPECIES: LCP family protein [Apilactobacillus]KOY71931.1 putative transcriptional regulator LytR [Apilactobacillus kunkeei DSM 12361 = ATCC 700308]MDN2613235.1 LCP family protein [Apilactobacillus sp. EABW-1NA]WJV43237.1 LCP family protein [Apilactobacillus kunkeei]CAI2651683.1 Polyisoprenyl-teichoic acid--peptidoglycan teichoic acid transferase TagU [Apilactobacillus kunkeei]CAI2656550.1 Polyisoprenyl-teichoic acid--peptidoglycan teichoic acid transferase TagU [Apilactobacillus kunkee
MNNDENMSRRNNKSTSKKHMKTWKKVVLWIIALLIVLLGVGAFAAYHNVKKTADAVYQPSGAKTVRDADSLLKSEKPVSLLFMGTDTDFDGRSDKGRTDSMMIVTLNPKTNTTTMVSIPRDMKVNLPDFPQYSPSKINAAYTYGGSKEAINAIESHFSIPVDYYVTLSLGGLKKAIDQVGGVDVVSPLTFSYEGQHYTKGKLEHMDGNKAMWFSNMRYQDPQGDYGRQYRQRLVLEALMKKAISYKTVINSDFLNSISHNLKTNLTMSDMLQLALHYRGTNKNIKSDYAHGTGEMLDGVSFQDVSGTEQNRISSLINESLKD